MVETIHTRPAVPAINSIRYIGIEPQIVGGRLLTDTGITIEVGQFVKKATADDGWTQILVADALDNGEEVALVVGLQDSKNNALLNSASVDAADFDYAQLWRSGSDCDILCKHTKLFNGTDLVEFDPATHTALAGKLQIRTRFNGEETLTYFSFH